MLRETEAVPYSEVQRLLREGQVKSVKITGNTIRAELTAPMPDGHTRVIATRVDPALAKELDQYGIAYDQVVEGTLLRDLLSWIVPALAFFAIWMFAMR